MSAEPTARDEILGRIRAALADRPEPTDVPWTYGAPVDTGPDGLLERFVERVADYRAAVDRVSSDDVAAAVLAALAGVGASRVVADDRVLAEWSALADSDDVVWVPDAALTPDELDAVDAVVTTATLGVANTGTLVLDHGPGQGRRAATLVPDVHICVVRADQVVSDIPEAVARLIETGANVRPLTWISGPSATSDIELDRVEGVHGPRTLHVVLAG